MPKSSPPKPPMSFYGVGPLYYLATGAVALGALTAQSFAGELFTWNALPTGISPMLGALLILAGVALYLAGFCSSRIARAVREGQLLTTGIYRRTRNPLYCGGLFGMTGILLLFENWLALPFFMFSYGLLRRLVRKEEDMLAGRFGEAYLIYRRHTNAVFPGRIHL